MRGLTAATIASSDGDTSGRGRDICGATGDISDWTGGRGHISHGRHGGDGISRTRAIFALGFGFGDG